MRRVFSLLVLGLIGLLAGPLAADKVVLKDGRTLDTKKPPEIRGRQAVLVLADGKLVSIPASEIDTAKTAALAKKAAEPPKVTTTPDAAKVPDARRCGAGDPGGEEGDGRSHGPGREGRVHRDFLRLGREGRGRGRHGPGLGEEGADRVLHRRLGPERRKGTGPRRQRDDRGARRKGEVDLDGLRSAGQGHSRPGREGHVPGKDRHRPDGGELRLRTAMEGSRPGAEGRREELP